MSKKVKRFTKKVFRAVRKVIVPVAIAAAVIYTGGAALGAAGAGAAGAAGAGATVSSTALLSAPVGVAKVAGSAIGKVGVFSTVAAAAKTAAPILQGVSAVAGLMGAGGRAQRITVAGDSGPGAGAAVAQSSEVATRTSAEVEEEERRRRILAANASTRQSTIRAGSLASRPTLASAGVLG